MRPGGPAAAPDGVRQPIAGGRAPQHLLSASSHRRGRQVARAKPPSTSASAPRRSVAPRCAPQQGECPSQPLPSSASRSLGWLAESFAAFGDRLGCVLLSSRGSQGRDDDALKRLLTRRPPGLLLALELLHPSWAADEVHRILVKHEATLVANDWDDRDEPTLRRIGEASSTCGCGARPTRRPTWPAGRTASSPSSLTASMPSCSCATTRMAATPFWRRRCSG